MATVNPVSSASMAVVFDRNHSRSELLSPELWIGAITAIGLCVVTGEARVLEGPSMDTEHVGVAVSVVNENQLVAWSLAGSVGSALVSIAMWGPNEQDKSKHNRASLWMFLANCVFGVLFAPALVNALHGWYGLHVNMANTMAVSAIVSFSAFSIVKPAGPIISAKLLKWIESLDMGAFMMRLLNVPSSKQSGSTRKPSDITE